MKITDTKREIKFRAWDKVEKRMCRVISLSPSDDRSTALLTIWSDFGNAIVVGDSYPKRFELMQYTGLKDKHGKEIYEGDIIRLDKDSSVYDHEYLLKVEWVKNGFSFQPDGVWEVVGNVFENPELLE